jgi:glycosyltransferase involved in cell wall biosynthesis
MSYGTPCAISDIPVFREVSQDAALYFDQQRPEAIKNTWLELINNMALQKQLSQRGMERAGSYKWDDVAASLYNRIMQTLERKQ